MRYTKVAIRQSSTPKVWLVFVIGLLLSMLGSFFMYALIVFGHTPKDIFNMMVDPSYPQEAVIGRSNAGGFVLFFPITAGPFLIVRAIKELFERHIESGKQKKFQLKLIRTHTSARKA